MKHYLSTVLDTITLSTEYGCLKAVSCELQSLQIHISDRWIPEKATIIDEGRRSEGGSKGGKGGVRANGDSCLFSSVC